MKISRAILTIACGTSLPLISALSTAGENYCDYDGPDIMT